MNVRQAFEYVRDLWSNPLIGVEGNYMQAYVKVGDYHQVCLCGTINLMRFTSMIDNGVHATMQRHMWDYAKKHRYRMFHLWWPETREGAAERVKCVNEILANLEDSHADV